MAIKCLKGNKAKAAFCALQPTLRRSQNGLQKTVKNQIQSENPDAMKKIRKTLAVLIAGTEAALTGVSAPVKTSVLHTVVLFILFNQWNPPAFYSAFTFPNSKKEGKKKRNNPPLGNLETDRCVRQLAAFCVCWQ